MKAILNLKAETLYLKIDKLHIWFKKKKKRVSGFYIVSKGNVCLPYDRASEDAGTLFLVEIEKVN